MRIRATQALWAGAQKPSRHFREHPPWARCLPTATHMTAPKDFNDSTLWRISAYERACAETAHSGFARLAGNSVLPSTLHAELLHLQHVQRSGNALEVVAACIRQRESALIILRHRGLVWPLTLFPQSNLYHLPRSLVEELPHGGRDIEVIDVEPPGLRPPGHVMHERVADRPGYRHLPPLLWALALHTPGGRLLEEIGGHAAYRIAAGCTDDGALGGALQSSFVRLRSEIASQRDIARWPGMDAERAARLLNGVYLQGELIVLRSHRAAHAEVATHRGLMDRFRSKR